MGSRDMKNKSSGKKLAVASAKVEVDNFIGNSNACLYETSQNKMDFSKLLVMNKTVEVVFYHLPEATIV